MTTWVFLAGLRMAVNLFHYCFASVTSDGGATTIVLYSADPKQDNITVADPRDVGTLLKVFDQHSLSPRPVRESGERRAESGERQADPPVKVEDAPQNAEAPNVEGPSPPKTEPVKVEDPPQADPPVKVEDPPPPPPPLPPQEQPQQDDPAPKVEDTPPPPPPGEPVKPAPKPQPASPFLRR